MPTWNLRVRWQKTDGESGRRLGCDIGRQRENGRERDQRVPHRLFSRVVEKPKSREKVTPSAAVHSKVEHPAFCIVGLLCVSIAPPE